MLAYGGGSGWLTYKVTKIGTTRYSPPRNKTKSFVDLESTFMIRRWEEL